jgi:DNA helicase-2/ATP-dependent DNA helicase PcrA
VPQRKACFLKGRSQTIVTILHLIQTQLLPCPLRLLLFMPSGPGSGKTRVVAARVANLVASGAAPESLLVITFTRKAAGELLQRLTELLGGELTSRLRPSTFHSLCANLLR